MKQTTGIKTKIIVGEPAIKIDVVTSTIEQLNEVVINEVARNPELEFCEGPLFPEDSFREDPEGLNPAFVEPAEESEDGQGDEASDIDEAVIGSDIALALEKVAEDHCGEDQQCLNAALYAIDKYRVTGRLTDDADDWLKDALRKLIKLFPSEGSRESLPTFRVEVKGDRVVAFLTSSLSDLVRIKPNVATLSERAKRFLEKKRARIMTLDTVASFILEDIQADFFRQPDLKTALLSLIPLPSKSLQSLDIGSEVTLTKSRLLRLGELAVSCRLGSFQLSLFWPQEAAVVRAWVQNAEAAGCDSVVIIHDWLLPRLQERASSLSGERLSLFNPLLDVSKEDIRNALKALKKKRQ